MFGQETIQIGQDRKRYRSRKSKASRFVNLSHTALKTKAGVGKVKHELFHLVVQVNQGKTLPLTFLTGIHSKNDDGTTV